MDEEVMDLLLKTIGGLTTQIAAISALMISKGVATEEEFEVFRKISAEKIKEELGS